ncbi:MAG: heavy-metal-associated domain-containing protein [Oscillospiraceae bacterium]
MSRLSINYTVKDINGKHDVNELKRGLGSLSGVISVSVNNKNQKIAVDFDTTGVQPKQLEMKIEEMGYDITHMQFASLIM